MFYAVAVLQKTIGGRDIFGIIVRNSFKRRTSSVICAFAFVDCIGMGHCVIARYLNVNRTTVWNRRNKLREKYLAATAI